MNIPYCGWNKNDKNNPFEAGDYDFMEYNEKETEKNDSDEDNSYQDFLRSDRNQPN
ncbi:hypothetical protein [Clostridium sp. KNHs216]|jgi:hypothetical protein|uniref:hypothetical protein n=1 Tax=Eubacteriales TaxID=186802 RepID=UPI0011730949|nr:hypothetical protein [Clostridium sp. KNHs216]TQI65867.1 hypothetical protein LY85_0512 [Clostridium sp. KNHs216]